MRLGEAMIKEGLITNDTLVRALERQVIFGARLGTNLVEMGAISEENLAKFLGKIFGVPYAGPEQFEDVPQEVLDAFPAEMARKYTAFPIKKERSRLHLAMTDPNDISVLDELRFILGLDVRGCIASEIRIHYALEKYYDIKRDLRYIAMPDEEGQAQYASSAPPDGPRTEDTDGEAGYEAQAPGMAPERPDAGLPPAATESIMPAMPEQRPATVPEPLAGQPARPAPVMPEAQPAKPAPEAQAEAAQVLTAPVIHAVKPAPTVQEVPAPPEPVRPVRVDTRPVNPYASLASPSDREDIAEAILAAAKASLARAALFMVKGSAITCWKVSGPAPAAGEISVTLDAPSIFKDVVEDRIFYKGPVLEVPQNMLLLDLLGGAAPLEAIAYPLIIKGKVVGVLYGDDGAGSMIKTDVRRLGDLMAKASMSLEILILKNKILADA